jgi:hypothetical protein
MLIKSCCFIIGLFCFEGCISQPKIGWKTISCEDESNGIKPYTLESLDRNYNCNKAQKEYR